MEPVIVHTNADHLIARLDTITFCLWKTRTTLLGVEKCREAYLKASDGGKRETAAFGIVFEGCSVPDPEVRAAVAANFDNPLYNLKVVVALIEGKGLSYTMKRTVAMGMSLLTQKKVMVHTFADVNDAAKHLTSKLTTHSQLTVVQAATALMARARATPLSA